MKITGAKVFKENHIFEMGDLLVSDGVVVAEDKLAASDEIVIDASGLYAIPGLVDIHFHGAVGHDFCDASLEGLAEIAEYEAKNGVLAICPATMTYSEEILGDVMDCAASFLEEQEKKLDLRQAELVGINLEGPFISPNKIGAQNPKYLTKADAKMLARLQKKSKGLIKLVDIAPEEEGALSFIKECAKDYNISLAHNVATYEIACEAFAQGARHVTHLFNAMPGITHRLPGPIIAAYENHAEVELIADGIHIHPAMVRFTFDLFDQDKVILIADSMEATGLENGQYQLGGQEVTKKGNVATLTKNPDTIAGSVTNLFDCMKTAVKDMGVALEDAVAAATINPAKAIGIADKFGRLESGCYANIVLMDAEMNIKYIIHRGKIL